MHNFFILALFAMTPSIASAWEHYSETEKDGRVFYVAEKIGDAGSFLNLVCFEQKIHIEVVFPFASKPIDDAVELMQVDHRPEHLVAGFVKKIDRATSVFIGVDRRDLPAASTPALLNEIAAGRDLYLGDPDRSEAVEHWSLKGSKQALKRLKKTCK